MDIRGKGALVTGASRGLGAALGRALAREGARVVLVARSPVDSGVVAEIRRDGGDAHWLVRRHRRQGRHLPHCGSGGRAGRAARSRGPQREHPRPDAPEAAARHRVRGPGARARRQSGRSLPPHEGRGGRHGRPRTRAHRGRDVGRIGLRVRDMGRLRRVQGRARSPRTDLGRGAGGQRSAVPDHRPGRDGHRDARATPCRTPTARSSPLRRQWRTASSTSSGTRRRSRAARASRRHPGAARRRRRHESRHGADGSRPSPPPSGSAVRPAARSPRARSAAARPPGGRRGGQRRRHAARVLRGADRRRAGARGAARGRERGRDMVGRPARARRLAPAHGGPAGAARARGRNPHRLRPRPRRPRHRACRPSPPGS